LDEGLADSLEGVAVDVCHVILKGVPGGAEGTLGTVGIIGDDVNAGDLRHAINGQMIVGDAYTLLLREETAKAYGLRSAPHFINNVTGIVEGQLFLIELGTLASHHVKEDAITGLVAIDMRIGRPVLGTESPSVTRVVSLFPLGEAPVFGIEADEVDAK
jgi:hypothetical protein